MRKQDVLKILDGKGGDYPDKFFNYDQLRRGIEVETEHSSIPMVAKIIAKIHLLENDRYYDYLDAMEEQMQREDGY